MATPNLQINLTTDLYVTLQKLFKTQQYMLICHNMYISSAKGRYTVVAP